MRFKPKTMAYCLGEMLEWIKEKGRVGLRHEFDHVRVRLNEQPSFKNRDLNILSN